LKLSQQLKAQKSFREIGLVSVEFETSISELFPLSGPTLTSTLMLDPEKVPETLVFNSMLTQLITQEGFSSSLTS
jgi:hypothetical protein